VESERVSLKFLKENRVLLIDEDEEHLVTAIADPFEQYVFDALDLISDKKIVVRIGVLSEIEQALDSLLSDTIAGKGKSDYSASTHAALLKDDVEQLKEMASEAPVIKRVNQILQKAVTSSASDIHIEPFENVLRVRFRVDGMLRDDDGPQTQDTAAIVSRVKIMANLNIAERRLPQDGRFKVRIHGDTIDLVILDMVMPGMGGGEVFDRLKAIDPAIKVLLSSGYSINGKASEIIDRGCAGFIQKPFNLAQLSEKVASVLSM
jgi:general secretion pathway protein E